MLALLAASAECLGVIVNNETSFSGSSFEHVWSQINDRNISSLVFQEGQFTKQDAEFTSRIYSNVTYIDYICFNTSITFEGQCLHDYAFWGWKIGTFEILSQACETLSPLSLQMAYCTTITIDYVTSIPREIFLGSQLQHVNANNAESIGEAAFDYCLSLTTASFRAARFIGNYSFSNCHMLTNITCGELCTVGSFAFRNCIKLASFHGTFAENISLGESCFSACTELEYINSTNIEVVPKYSFYDCLTLTDFCFNGITFLAEQAFNGCYSLKEINAPNLEQIGHRGFGYCNSVEKIELSALHTVDEYCFTHMTSLKTVILPVLFNISSHAFDGCCGLKEINLPASTIGEECFTSCRALRTVKLNNLTTLGKLAFEWCEGLRYIHMNALQNTTSEGCFHYRNIYEFYAPLLESIPSKFFYQCQGLQIVMINNTRTIGDCAFFEASCYNTINLSRLKTVGNSAFEGCYMITLSINQLDKVGARAFAFVYDLSLENGNPLKCKEIGKDAFLDCSSTLEIDIEYITDLSSGILSPTKHNESRLCLPNLKYAKSEAFANLSNLETLELPNLTCCYDTFIKNCSMLNSISVGNLQEIWGGVFLKECPCITRLDLPSLINCCDGAFKGMHNLVEISMPKCTIIPNECFSNCSLLMTLSLSVDVTEIGSYSFNNCRKLTNLSSNWPKLTTIGHHAFRRCGLSGFTATNITSISKHAFAECKELINVSIETCTDIHDFAFECCSVLESVSAASVKWIYSSAFYNCSNLKHAHFEKLEGLNGDKQFSGCTSLLSVNFQGLTKVGSNSSMIFNGCTSLETIYLASTPPVSFHPEVFVNTGRNFITIRKFKVVNITLCLPEKESYERYSETSPIWKNLYAKKPQGYHNLCPLLNLNYWSAANMVTPIIVLCVIIITLGVIMGIGTTLFIRKHKREREEEHRKQLLTRLVLDDFG